MHVKKKNYLNLKIKIMRFIVFFFVLSLCTTRTTVYARGDTTRQYLFNSNLSNGYKLVYKHNDSLQYLFLSKGKMLKLLSTEEIYNKQSLLGFVTADFDDYFVLVHTLHVVNIYDPIMFDLFEKKTASIVLKGFYLDAKNNMLLYHNNDSMKLYNVISHDTETFAFPMQDSGSTWLVNKIAIKSITTGTLTVTFYDDRDAFDGGRQKIKSYKR